jgi:hypothetical protein
MTEFEPNQPPGMRYPQPVPPPNVYPAPAAGGYPSPYPPQPTGYPGQYPQQPAPGARPPYAVPTGAYPPPAYPPPAYPYPGAPAATYPPRPTAPPPKRRGWLVAVIVAVVVLAAAGTAVAFLGGDKKDPVKTAASAPDTSATTGATSTPTATPTPTVQAGTTKLSPTQLYAALVPYPSGTRRITPSGTSNGIMSISQFAKREYEDQKKATDYLRYYEFSTAATKMWATSHDRGFVFVTLIEFDGSTSNAQTFAKDEADNDRDARPAAARNGPLTGGPDGYYFQFNTPDKNGWRYLTTYAQVGKIVIEAEYDSRSTLTSSDLSMLLKLTKDQAARIK